MVHCFLKIWFNKRMHPNERRNGQKPPCCHSWRTTKWAEAVAETNQLWGRGFVLVPRCAMHILGNWLIVKMFASAAKLSFVSLLTSKLFGFNFMTHFTPIMCYICFLPFTSTFYLTIIRLITDLSPWKHFQQCPLSTEVVTWKGVKRQCTTDRQMTGRHNWKLNASCYTLLAAEA